MTDFSLGATNHYTWAISSSGYIKSTGRIKNYTYTFDGNYGYSGSEANLTEGQSYGMIMAALNDDLKTFDLVWQWTKAHMQLSVANIASARTGKQSDINFYKDRSGNRAGTDLGRTSLYLFGWIYKDNWDTQNTTPHAGLAEILNATDGDVFIAYALLLAYERFGTAQYRTDALNILADLNLFSVKLCNGHYYLNMGAYSGFETATLHIMDSSYLCPYMFAKFAKHDTGSASIWTDMVTTSTDVISASKTINGTFAMPSMMVGVNKTTGALVSSGISGGSDYNFDSFRTPVNLAVDKSTASVAILNDTTHGLYKYYTDNTKIPQVMYADGTTVNYFAPAWNNYANLDYSPHNCAAFLAQKYAVEGLTAAQTFYTAMGAGGINYIQQTGDGYWSDNTDYYVNWPWYQTFHMIGDSDYNTHHIFKQWLVFNEGSLGTNQTAFNSLLSTINTAAGYPTSKVTTYSVQYKHSDNRLAMPIYKNVKALLSGAQQTACVAELPSGTWTPQ